MNRWLESAREQITRLQDARTPAWGSPVRLMVLIALAASFVAPLLSPPRGDQLLSMTLILGGMYLLVVARPGHEHPWVDRVLRAASAAVLVAGVWLLPRGEVEPAKQGFWQPYDETVVEQAIAAGTPVVLDFYATWCAPCKELDKRTFTDPRVAARLRHFSRFKVDLTTADAASERIRNRFSVAGVPTVAFFVDGREVFAERLTGFEHPESFLRRLDRLGLPANPGPVGPSH